MEERARIPVSTPHPHPTASYWQDPPHALATHRSTPSPPSTTDVAIVGSGISGASIAHHLHLRSPSTQILILEARTACSGATGRNGGHTKAASYRSFVEHREKLGLEEALRIARLEMANIRATHELARQNNIKCDSRPCQTVDVVYDQEQWTSSLEGAEQMNRATGMDGSTEVYTTLDAKEVAEKYLCEGALGGFTYEAGSISAYRFTMGLLQEAVDNGANLQTQTTVTSIEKLEGQHAWLVKTDRGDVRAKQVVLATNGYTAHLERSVQGVIVPLRGQVTAQRPGSKLPKPCLPTTYTFAYEDGYDYMIPQPEGSDFPGDIVIGGGWTTLPDQGVSEFGLTDDSVKSQAISEYLFRCTGEFFGKNWGEDDIDGRVRKEWTGIMGTSADGLPYVGQVPGKAGLWMSASFNGHGMVLCFKCAEAVTAMMSGDETALDEWFPRSFRLTPARLKVQFEGRRNMKPPADLCEPNPAHDT